KLVDLVLEDEPLRMPGPRSSEQDVEWEKASMMRKITSYEGLLQALQEVLKKENHDLNICIASKALINIKTLEANNEV
ncbi:hypothetical protein KI387_026626, partial [Taxus chinensis]